MIASAKARSHRTPSANDEKRMSLRAERSEGVAISTEDCRLPTLAWFFWLLPACCVATQKRTIIFKLKILLIVSQKREGSQKNSNID